MYSTFNKNDSGFSTKKAEKSVSSVRCLYLTNKKMGSADSWPFRGEWGYLDRFLFFSCGAFPNHPICKINVLLYLSHVLFILFKSR